MFMQDAIHQGDIVRTAKQKYQELMVLEGGSAYAAQSFRLKLSFTTVSG